MSFYGFRSFIVILMVYLMFVFYYVNFVTCLGILLTRRKGGVAILETGGEGSHAHLSTRWPGVGRGEGWVGGTTRERALSCSCPGPSVHCILGCVVIEVMTGSKGAESDVRAELLLCFQRSVRLPQPSEESGER